MRKRPDLRTRLTTPLLVLLILAMVVNLGLAVYIQLQKEQNLALIPEALRGDCFEDAVGGGGCGAVQTSRYATTLGFSNPHIGYVGFSALAGLLAASLIARRSGQKAWVRRLAPLIMAGMALGSAFSLWLLYAQFFLIHYTCIYCLWVDGFMLAATAVYAWVAWPELNA
jgi:uncharacterized membrane protein